MKKRICSMLAISMASSVLLTACGSSDTAKETLSAETTVETIETEPVSTFEADDLPSDLNYNGATVTTFGWSGPALPEFFVEEQNGDLVNDAIFQRNLTVEERLGIRLAYHLELGNSSAVSQWLNSVTSTILAGGGDYDIVAGYSMAGASLAAEGYLIDLNDISYINLEKPWWPEALQDEATCGGKLYFGSGDISAYYTYYLYCMVFNKQLVIDYGIEDLYALVLDGKWTLDKMMSLASVVSGDLDGNGEKDIMDLYGYSSHALQVDPYYFASGLSITEKDEKDIPSISPDFKSEKTVDLVTKLIGFFGEPYAYLDTADGEIYNNFPAGNSLFTTHEVMHILNKFRDSEVEYGVLPLPKYDEKQDNYVTILSFPYSLYGIPVDAKDSEMSGAVMECLASESYRTVSPALFEKALKVKYAHDNEVAKMWDIIRSTTTFDLGRVFANEFNGITYALFRSEVASGKVQWASAAEKNMNALNSSMEKLIEALLQE